LTLEALFGQIAAYRSEILVVVAIAPWLTGLICLLVPGQEEEPFLLSTNLWLAMLSVGLWLGYLAYTLATGGWVLVVRQADVLLLLAPIYYLGASVWVASRRLPLARVPAFRSLQGLAAIAVALLAMSWILGRIRILAVFLPAVFLAALVFGTAGGVGILGLPSLGGLNAKTHPSRQLAQAARDISRRHRD
jgi:hypothetical protein